MTKIQYQDYFNKATQQVFILKILYIINIPLAKIFVYFKIKPHTITTLSNLSAFIALFFIFYNIYIFMFLWFLSLSFDICDGIVARLTKQSSASGSFYDHFSDIIKIFSLYIVLGIYYNTSIIWILASLNIAVFALLTYTNMVLSNRNQILALKIQNESHSENIATYIRANQKNIIKRIINKIPKLKTFLLFCYSSIFVIYGNFNLLLLPLVLNEKIAIYTFILLFIVVFKSLIGLLTEILHVNNKFDTNNISWK